MSLAIGATVVYPVHGVAEVVGRETRTFVGETQTYLVLLILGDLRSDDLRVLIREDRLGEVGVREVMSELDAVDVLDVLAVRNPRLSPNWSRRFKNHQAKLKSGDVFEVAEVVRNLTLRQRVKALGAAEKAMYRQARTTLVSELAVTWGITSDAAANRVDVALRP
ncbi:MAG: CarD family transcriptional regulator [Acidimicrobiia bacterium]|nr:CarD family transcriptional regulator [Acidimicrobiia bacterium]